MKLESEVTPRRDGKRWHGMAYNDGDIEHYAACTLALMLALDRWASRRAGHASYATFVLGHADGLMTQWGFDSGEDA